MITTSPRHVSETVKLHQGLTALLQELRTVVGSLTGTQYVQKPVGPVRSSIGGHVRHALDHLEAAILFEDFAVLNYDRRSRGTPVEMDRDAALAKIDELLRALQDLPAAPQSRPLTLAALVSAEGGEVSVESTAARELLFVFSHTLHHNALIRVLVELLGGHVPERFGYAPATLAYLDAQSCVR